MALNDRTQRTAEASCPLQSVLSKKTVVRISKVFVTARSIKRLIEIDLAYLLPPPKQCSLKPRHPRGEQANAGPRIKVHAASRSV